MPRSNEIVRVAARRGTSEIPWMSRQELLERLRRDEAASALVDRFERVGTSPTVELNDVDAARLLAAIEAWSDELGSVARLPEGLYELRNALHDHNE